MKRCARATRPYGQRPWLSLIITCVLLGAGLGILAAVSLTYTPESHRGVIACWNAAPVKTEPRVREAHIPIPDIDPPHLPEPILPTPEPVETLSPPTITQIDTIPELPQHDDTRLTLTEQDFTPPASKPRAAAPTRAPRKSPPPAPAAASVVTADATDYTPPAYRDAPLPPYPANMRQSRIQGDVRLRIYLDATGTPQKVEIAGSSGHVEFDSTAKAWVLRHWKFFPARKAGSPIPGIVTTRVQFVLD